MCTGTLFRDFKSTRKLYDITYLKSVRIHTSTQVVTCKSDSVQIPRLYADRSLYGSLFSAKFSCNSLPLHVAWMLKEHAKGLPTSRVFSMIRVCNKAGPWKTLSVRKIVRQRSLLEAVCRLRAV